MPHDSVECNNSESQPTKKTRTQSRFGGHQVVFDSAIANKLGINAAIILSRILWSIEQHRKSNGQAFYKDGRWWMYDTVDDLMAYSCIPRRTLLTYLKTLRDQEIIIAAQFTGGLQARTNWYSVDRDKLAAALGQQKDSAKMAPSLPHEDSAKMAPSHSAKMAPSYPEDSAKMAPSHSISTKSLKETKNQPPKSQKKAEPHCAALAPLFSSSKGGGLKVVKGERGFSPTEVHQRLAVGLRAHLEENHSSVAAQASQGSLEYWAELLLNQAGRGLRPEVGEHTLLGFLMFLIKRVDSNKKWPGWGKVIGSIPEAVMRKDGTCNFDKAWSVFGPTFEKQMGEYIDKQDVEAQRAAERAQGLNLPF